MSIELRNVSYVYNSGTSFEKTALRDINIKIEPGEFVGIIGHTGSGKSTLIQHFNALLPPTEGLVLLNGEDINADKNRLKDVRRRVGLVFQYPEHQLFEVSVYKDVAFGLKLMSLEHLEADRRVRAALSAVGICEDYYEKSPFELSGGEKRRVAIAGVLAMEPEILILDEPTAGLDPRGRDEILSQIKHMREELKITVILVSHSMEDVARLVDRVFVLNNGEIALSGTVGEVFSRAGELEAMGLSAPQITYLMKELAASGFNVRENIYTVEEAAKELLSLWESREKQGYSNFTKR
ncbi:MAG: energy-coupling factor transporter ATPase [Clostridiales bacterium]|jgi:energy-coupling factor transport system ATP-binding protein|nr:energy-coupling factor transporter ATPase [Clostridiales bacterium]